MSDNVSEQKLAEDHKRYKQLISSFFKAFILSLVIGLVGGYAIYQMMPAGKFPAVILYIPGIVTALIYGLVIRKRKKEWFPTQEALIAASQYKPTQD